MPKRPAERGRDPPGPRRRPDEGELLDLELVAPGAGPLADDDVQAEVLHGRVEDLLDRGLEAVDLVDEEDLPRLHVGEDGREVARPLDDRARGRLDGDAHLLGDEVGQARLAEPRRAVEEDVVELFAPLLRRLDEDLEVGLDRLLADELGEALRAEAVLEEDVLLRPDGAEDRGHRGHSCAILPNRGGKTNKIVRQGRASGKEGRSPAGTVPTAWPGA